MNLVKVSESQMYFLLKLNCPKNEQNISSVFGAVEFREKIAFEICGSLVNLDLQICKIKTALEHTIVDLKPANIHSMRKYAILK